MLSTLSTYPIAFRVSARRFVCTGLVAAVVLLTALAVTAQSASAYQGGWDRNHWWVKVTSGEIASGAAGAICGYFVDA